MLTISIEEMQRDLRDYLHRVEAGETITVTDAEHPVQKSSLLHRTRSSFVLLDFMQGNSSSLTISMRQGYL